MSFFALYREFTNFASVVLPMYVIDGLPMLFTFPLYDSFMVVFIPKLFTLAIFKILIGELE